LNSSSPSRSFNAVELQKIAGVRYRQDAAVSAYIIVKWLGDDGKQYSKDLGPWKPINTEEQFVLKDEGVPEGVWVRGCLPYLFFFKIQFNFIR
jgi:hypothetical protein